MSFPCPSCHYVATSKSGQLAHQRIHTNKQTKGTIEQKSAVVLSDSGSQVFRCGGCRHEVKYYASHLKHLSKCAKYQASLKKRELNPVDDPPLARQDSKLVVKPTQSPRQVKPIQPPQHLKPPQPIQLAEPTPPAKETEVTIVASPTPAPDPRPALEPRPAPNNSIVVSPVEQVAMAPSHRLPSILDPDLSTPRLGKLQDLVPFKGIPIFDETLNWMKSYLSRYPE